MRKRIVVPVVLSVVLMICFIPIKSTVTIQINAPYFNVYKQFAAPGKWLKWQPALRSYTGNKLKIDSNKTGFSILAPSFAYRVKRTGISEFEITGNKSSDSNYAFIPDDKTNKTTAIVTRTTNAFGYAWYLLTKNLRDSPIADLKRFMEAPLLYYGFIIKKELTHEKLLAVKRGTFSRNDIYRNSKVIQAELNNFSLHNKLKVSDLLQLQYVSRKGDSTEIMLGLPVNDKIKADVEYMNMPQGKILVGYFKGKYKNRDKLYTAMRTYMNDNYIHPMIQPFERFQEDKLPSADSTTVDMQVVIPYM